jgi:ABC-type lipoprotein release transport system permease subunit
VLLPFYIAKRYLFSKKSHNIINIISLISVAGVTIGTAALIIVLSVFNGFEDLVLSLFNTFNPDLKIEVREGKTFTMDGGTMGDVRKIPGVVALNEVIEENALIKFRDQQHVITLKGVSKDFIRISGLRDHIIGGSFPAENAENYALMGAGVAYYLSLYIGEFTPAAIVFVPDRLKKGYAGLQEDAFISQPLQVTGVFTLQQEYDMNYVVVPVEFTRSLFRYDRDVTSVEVYTMPGKDIEKIQEEIATLLGPGFTVKNRFQQQALLYKVLKSEKWSIFLILTFILIIAAFNVIGSLSMLILDKKKDIAVLWSLGADKKLIKRIFMTEGIMISVFGGIAGLILGGLLAGLQQAFGLVSLGNPEGSFIIDAYPVKVEVIDFILVFVTVMIIGLATAWYPVRQISKKYLSEKLNFFFMR